MKQLVIMLTVALAALGAGAIRMQQHVGEYREQIADLQTRLKRMEAQQLASVALADQKIEGRTESITPPTLATPAPESGSGAGDSTALADFAKKIGTADRDVRLAKRRARLPGMYPGLGRWLELTPEQENELFDLLAKLGAEREDAMLDPEKLRDQVSQKGAATILLTQSQASDPELAALLGNKYPKFQEYQQANTVHKQVNQLQGMFNSGADTLTNAQIQSLTKALVTEKLRIDQEQGLLPPPAFGQDSTDLIKQRIVESNRRLLQVAALQLSPRQLEGYRKLIEHQQEAEDAFLDLAGKFAAGAQAADR